MMTPMVTPPVITSPLNLRRYVLVRSPTRGGIDRRQGLDPCVRSDQHNKHKNRGGTEHFLQAHFRFPPMPKESERVRLILYSTPFTVNSPWALSNEQSASPIGA
jgi:hypothetical protein